MRVKGSVLATMIQKGLTGLAQLRAYDQPDHEPMITQRDGVVGLAEEMGRDTAEDRHVVRSRPPAGR
jgi:hypothetical protein